MEVKFCDQKKILISGAGDIWVVIFAIFSKLNYDLVCLEINKSSLSLLKKLYPFKNKKYYFSVDITNQKNI